jgi:hypothetical protein
MADDNSDGFGEGNNYFSSFKVGGVAGNIYGPTVTGAPSPGVKRVPALGKKGEQLFNIDGTIKYRTDMQNRVAFVDGSDAYANQGFTISFQSVINDKVTVFKAFVTAFNETYSSNWNSEEVFGRADPIHMFRNTTRNITLSFMIPASTEGEAYENLAKTQELIQKLYPAYTDVQGAQTIAQSPLVRMKVINMTQRASVGNSDVQGHGYDPQGANFGIDAQFTMTPDASQGLLGIIKNLTVNHHLDDPNAGVFEVKKGVLLPKLIEIQIEFGAIHEMPLAQKEAWRAAGDFESFPYGMLTPSAALDKAAIQQQIDDLHSAWTKQMAREREEQLGKEQADQAKENAEARYAGLLGKSRFKKDQNRLANNNIKNDEKRRYIQSAVVGEHMNKTGAGFDTAVENIDGYERTEYDMYGEII